MLFRSLIVIDGLGLYQSAVEMVFGISYSAGPWLASIIKLQPDVSMIGGSPLINKLHIIVVWCVLSGVCCILSGVCCLLSVVCCLVSVLSVICCLLSVVCHLLFVVCCLLSAACCLLFVVCCRLFVVCSSVFGVCCHKRDLKELQSGSTCI